MPTLSFDKTKGAIPVAIAKGGEFDGEVLYVNTEDVKSARRPKHEIKAKDYYNEMRSLQPMERVKLINRLEEAKAKGLSPDQLIGETPLAKKIYERVLDDESKNTNVIELPDDSVFNLIPSPDPKKREVFYIAGASGSGKSYMAKNLAEYYQKFFPDRDVYLISKLEEDSTLDSMRKPPKRISVQSLIDDYPSIDEFENCMVIMDDYDGFTGDALKTVRKLINDIATMGRHTNTTMLCLSHYLNSGVCAV